MTYAVSDIHGCYDKYKKLLQTIGFGPDDTLYFLGDAIDRGPYGFKVLLDMASRPNVLGIKGNHEAMAMDVLPGIGRCLADKNEERDLTDEEREALDLWFYNGGELSLADFLSLYNDDCRKVWNYMASLPLYREVEAGGRKFVLVHGGLENFSPARPLADYTPPELLWCRPKPDTVYYPDRYVVVGHTPTCYLFEEAEKQFNEAGKSFGGAGKWFNKAGKLFDGAGNPFNKTGNPSNGAGKRTPGERFFRTDSFIDIDCGCVYTDVLGCLCLDTMEEIYV